MILGKVRLFHIGPTSRDTWYMVHLFRVLPEKGNTGGHGVSQRQEKSLIRDLPAKGVTLPQKLLLAGSISEPPHNPLILWCFGRFGWQNPIYYKTRVPPSHPADYFSTFEMNTKSKEPARKTQGKGNWHAGWFHGKMAHTKGYKGEKSGWLKLPEKHSNEPAVIWYWLLVPFLFWRYHYDTNQSAIFVSHFTNIQYWSQMTCGYSFSELKYDNSERRITCEIRG